MTEQLGNLTGDVVQLRIAAQLAPRRWQRELDRLRADLESGHSWEQAVEGLRNRQPELGNLMGAALAAGHPASITMNLFQQRATSRMTWQQLLLSLVYPVGLLLVALLISSLMSMSMMTMATHGWRSPGEDSYPFNDQLLSRLSDYYDASVGGLLLVGWCLVLVGTTYAVASPSAWLKLVSGVPVLGRPYRWMALSELLNRIAVFSQFQPELRRTLELTEQSFGQLALAPISRYLLESIERGEALPNAIHKTIVSDTRAGLVLTLINPNDLSNSTRRASQLLDEMILATCNHLRMILPVFIMLVVASIIWGVWSSYFELFEAFRKIFFYW